MNYSIIVAVEKSGGIGVNNKIPWHHPQDMAHFKRVTKGGIVIMGRNTWDSIPVKYKPLKDRINIVISNTMVSDSIMICKSLSEAKMRCKGINETKGEPEREVYIIGGSRLYTEALCDQDCKQVFLTRLNKSYKCDTFLDLTRVFSDYTLVGRDPIPQGAIERYHRGPKAHDEYSYLNIVKKILDSGEEKPDRTGTGTISLFGESMSFSLENYTLPILTTKRVPFRIVLEELLWFISADTNAKTLQEKGIRIWDGNSSREYLDSIGLKDRQVGDLGPVYGFQWRHYSAEYFDCHTDYTDKGIDQLNWVINEIKTNPKSRRLFMTSWNPKDLDIMAIPPCHLSIQFNVGFADGVPTFLDSCLYQRSADIGLGVPFNITSYSIMTMTIARLTGLKPRKFTHFMGDCHIYKDHIPMMEKQWKRIPLEFPTLNMKEHTKDYKSIDDFKFDDFFLSSYKSYKTIKMKMSI